MHTKTKVSRVPLAKASANLGALVRRVHNNKERFIVEKNGVPVAALLNIDEYEDYLDAQDPELKRQIKEGHAEYRRGRLREDLDTFLVSVKASPERAVR